jgi:dTDP-glucose 4,6-dehydratase
MKLLVTGGAGFIGSNFILYWLEKHPEDSVVNFDKLTYAGNLENLTSVEKNSQYQFIQGDITSARDVEAALQNVDTVVHFAAESHVDRSILEPAQFIVTNVVGTQVLLDQALKVGVKRFHHISTDEVFGSLKLEGSDKFNETTPYDPKSPYSASKAASDHLVRAYGHTYGLPITISNCSNNYGPYQFPEKFISLAITNILENKKVPIYGDGLYVRDWLHVIDHCRAIDVILEKGVIGETYCIGGMTNSVNNKTIIQKILGLLGKDETIMEYIQDRPGHDRKYAVDWSKIHTELGWSPTLDLDTGLAQTVAWYKNNKEWTKHVKSGDYVSYYTKQYKNAV